MIGRFGGLDQGELLRCRARATLDERLHPPREDAARHQDPVPAAKTDEADVRAETDNTPVRAAARMRLAETDDVIDGDVQRHLPSLTQP